MKKIFVLMLCIASNQLSAYKITVRNDSDGFLQISLSRDCPSVSGSPICRSPEPGGHLFPGEQADYSSGDEVYGTIVKFTYGDFKTGQVTAQPLRWNNFVIRGTKGNYNWDKF
jgi:hypothetical protein